MTTRIAIDCMGGDHGPSVTVPAVLRFFHANPRAHLILVGRRDEILVHLAGQAEEERLRIVHADEVVGMDESPALALRNKKNSSMRVALELVKAGEADASVSAGNTGALMAISRFVLKMLPGIERPAICSRLPTVSGHTLMLDLGANVDCSPQHLLQFALMGSALVAATEHKNSPSVGLLNIGSEDIKGNEVVKASAELLKASGLNFVGNVEGDGIYKGHADVVVCDGFVGNVALKASEGLVQLLATFLRQEFKRNVLTQLLALLVLPVLNRFKQRVDPRRYNGAILLGLKGISVKSHGSADGDAFLNAISRAFAAAESGFLSRISEHFSSDEDVPLAAENA